MGRFSKLETRAKSPGGDPAASRASAPSNSNAPPPVEEQAYDAAALLRQGDEAWFGGDAKKALRFYSRAMQEDAACLDAWIHQIRVLILTSQLSEAAVWINRALSIFPDAPGLISLRAVHHARGGMLRRAMESSDAVLSKRGDDAGAWVARGHILSIATNKNAEFCFEQAMKLTRADDWRTPFWIGLALDLERKWSMSIHYYEQALARRGSLPYAWLRIARAHANLGRAGASRQALTRAEETCGDNERLRAEIRRTGTGSIFGRLKALFSR